MCCVRFLQRVLTCSEKDISSSISRPSSVTFITLVSKLPLQVIPGLLFILVQSRFPFTNWTFGLFLIEWKPIGQCPVRNVWYRCIKRFLQSSHAVTVCWRCDYSVACIKDRFQKTWYEAAGLAVWTWPNTSLFICILCTAIWKKASFKS